MKQILPLFLILLVACQSHPSSQVSENRNRPEMSQRDYVVMVSMDGFRHDYIEKYQAKAIARIGDAGIRAETMIPSFPSSTFPNHYSLATGMYPASHGIIGNSFYDPEREELYQIRDREKVEDGSFYGGTPLWVLAEKAGMLAASFFWVGSEADIQGVKPSYYYRYDGSIPNQERVDQVLEWLSLPEDQRPHFITIYFSDIDSKGHRHGPESEQTQKAVQDLDKLIGQLDKRLGETGLPIHLIITSDHGMQLVDQDNPILPERLAKLDGFDKVVKSSTYWTFHSKDRQLVESTHERLKKLSAEDYEGKFRIFKTAEGPDYLHYKSNPRIGQLVMTPDSPYVLSSWGFSVGPGHHGYDPYRNRNMHTIFLAKGPQIQAGLVVPSFENIHVYPLVAHILELDLPDNLDGSFALWDSTGAILPQHP